MGEKNYDGAVGSAGFLVEAFEYLKTGRNLTTTDLETLQKRTFYGKEKKSLAYIIGTMNLILHGIEAPNIVHTNTLAENLSDIQEKERAVDFGRRVLNALFGTLPDFFKNEDELRVLQRLIQAENSDLFDVLEYISFARKPISRADRVAEAESHIFALLDPQQEEFLEFVLDKYIESGVEELDREKLPGLLMLKYHSIPDAVAKLGGTAAIQSTFIDFQKYLYQQKAA